MAIGGQFYTSWQCALVATALLCVSALAEKAEAQACSVPDFVFSRIEATLCGGAPEYSFSGLRCFEMSLAQRLRDTEAQAAKLEDCGYENLAADVREAGVRVAEAMNALAVCLPGGKVAVEALAERAADTVSNQGRSHGCTAADKRLLELRLADFHSLVQRAREPGAAEEWYRALGVQVDAQGTVSAR